MVAMNVKEAVLAALKELIVPEIQEIKREQGEFKVALGLTNKRLDDINAHLVDQSRRIDETNKRIDKIHADLIQRIDITNLRIDESNQFINRLYEALNRIYAIIPVNLPDRVAQLEQAVQELRKHQAA